MAEGVKAVAAQTQWINQQVSSGQLALKPESAEAAAKVCENEIRELQQLVRRADLITRVSGLGNYPNGQQLAQRFVDKATLKGVGAVDLIRQMQDELRKMADAYRAAAKDYRAIDEQHAQDIQRGLK
ncbi:hypothetical protein [Saccharopolyspora thermophila]|uniref:hypothetical protein n=1 Tax=Saccharopolyspora thermophila TaxID=89367 RepID=UPI001E50B996|nr:hypothetical protein [Saccharopolyspora subtropica]